MKLFLYHITIHIIIGIAIKIIVHVFNYYCMYIIKISEI